MATIEKPLSDKNGQEDLGNIFRPSGNPTAEDIRNVYESFPFPSGGTPELVSNWTELIKRYFTVNDIDIKDKLFLDAGCGTGDNLVGFAKAFPQIRFSACDLSGVSVDIAKANINNNGIENVVSCEQQDLMKFKSSIKFDFIASLGVLHHTPSPECCLKNLMEALKSGGTIFVDLYGYFGRLRAEMAQRIINLLVPDLNNLEDRIAAMEWVKSNLLGQQLVKRRFFGRQVPIKKDDPEYICWVDDLLTPVEVSYKILDAIKFLVEGGATKVLWWDAPKLSSEALIYTNCYGHENAVQLPAPWSNRIEKMTLEERYQLYELWFSPIDFFLVGQK